jgi:integrase
LADPTFREFAAEWRETSDVRWRDRTREYTDWALTHLLPTFGDTRVSMITARDVRRYVAEKRGTLSASSVNKTLDILGAVLAMAAKDGIYVGDNPARDADIRLKGDRRPGRWLEPEQVAPLLAAAGENRALLVTAILRGLRSGELCALRYGDVNLATGQLIVRESKTTAGVRRFRMTPQLLGELKAHKARGSNTAHDDLVFTTSRGTPQTQGNFRRRVLPAAIKAANRQIVKAGGAPISETLTPHSLRHTCRSLLLAAGMPVPRVMKQLGHTSEKTTLGIYAHVLEQADEYGAAVDALALGVDWARMGTNAEMEATGDAAASE